MTNPWKIPANPFSMFASKKKQKPYYGKALPAEKIEKGKQLIEEYEVKEDDKGNINVDNATSWDSATHPNGAGPSKLVDDIKYDNDTKDLTVTYRDGFKAVYHNMERGDVFTFATAGSKGRWAHEHLWGLPYDRG